MTIFRFVSMWLLALLGALATPALAVTYPPAPNGPILDEANLLPPDREAALDARLRAFNAQTGKAVIVATVNSLQDESIEIYAVKLFEAWGIGGKESDSGLLMLVAPNERKVRIEVGYGLHGYVTDGLSGRIIRTIITPRFKQGDMAGGIEAGTDALLQQLSRSPEDAKAIAEAAEAARRQDHRVNAGDVFKAVIIVIVVLFIIIISAVRAASRAGRRYRSGGGVAPIVVWAASEILSDALRGGRGGGGGWGGGGGDWGGGGGGGFGGFGGGGSGGGGASGGW
ncbi:MAG TPA: TPM domain-containing protein [Sphingobium sp.]